MKALNVFFVVLFLLFFLANGFFIFSYAVEGKSLTQAVVSLANNSLEVIDTVWKPELKKTDNYTGILIMGIDSRELNFDGQEFEGDERNIDTIMQVIVNHDTNDVTMISIPRDTGITASDECVDQTLHYSHSINYIYKEAIDGNCPEPGYYYMQKYVESITGFDNHYYTIISFQAFRDIINTVGEEQSGERGLYIDVPRDFREYYPREHGGGFETISFKKGYQFIDSTMLLKYARSRQATSDFDRARRQQQVVEAVQQKVMSSETLSDPTKIFELYQTFQSNALFSEFTLDEIRAALSLLKNVDSDKIFKVVLDDELGGLNSLLTKPVTSRNGTHSRPNYYLSPVHYNDPECVALDDEYCKVKQYLRSVYEDPDIVAEQAKIFAYSNIAGRKVSNVEFDAGKEKFPMPIGISRFAKSAREDWGSVQIYDFSDGEFPKTIEYLEEAFGVEVLDGSTAAFKSPLNKEDFTIVVKTN